MNNTLQKSYPSLAKKLGLPGFWIKHEYLNESGSHKIRLMKLLMKKKKNFVLSSSGNAAIAAAYYLNKYLSAKGGGKVKLTIFVSKNISSNKWQRLKKAAGNAKNIVIKKTDRPKQQAFLFSKKHKAVLLRGSIEKISPWAYHSLAKELSKIPGLKAVFVPTSSGITALGIHQGFKKLKKKIEIHLVQTEKIHSLAKDFDHNFSLSKKSLAQGIVDKTGLRKKEVVQAVKESLGSGWIISDQLLKKTKKIYNKEISPDFISYDALLSLAGVIKARKKNWPFSGQICCLFSGY